MGEAKTVYRNYIGRNNGVTSSEVRLERRSELLEAEDDASRQNRGERIHPLRARSGVAVCEAQSDRHGARVPGRGEGAAGPPVRALLPPVLRLLPREHGAVPRTVVPRLITVDDERCRPDLLQFDQVARLHAARLHDHGREDDHRARHSVLHSFLLSCVVSVRC